MKSVRILIVDESELLLLAMRDILMEEGHIVFTATSVAQALDIIYEVSPQLIISDMQNLDTEGVSLCQVFHTCEQWAVTPLVSMCVHSVAADVNTLTRSCATDYLLKPFDAQTLLALVSQYA